MKPQRHLLFIIGFILFQLGYGQCALTNLADDLVDASDEFKSIINDNEGFDAYRILSLAEEDIAIRSSSEAIHQITKHLSDIAITPEKLAEEIKKIGGYEVWALRTGKVRHPDWIEITDISNKIETRMSRHVDYLDFKGNGFHGCHTQNAMDQFLANNPGWTGGFIDESGNAISLLNDSPIEAYPWVRDVNGNLFTKTNGAQKIINGIQYGKASFFPKNWNTSKLKVEVEHAISHNHGLLNGNTYSGFSKDGSVEIWFYYNTSNGSIISFFPKVN